MRSRFPHGGEVLGAAPANPILAPVLSQDRALSMSRQREMLDLQAIQRIPGLVGYWKADPQYMFEDYTTLTTPTLGGVVGKVLDLSAPQTLGSELLTNGTMDSSTSPWSSGSQSPANCTTRTIESGRLKYVCVDAGLSYSYATQILNSTLQLGAEYQVYFELECTVPIKVTVFNHTSSSNTIFSTVYQPGTYVISRPVHLAVTTSLNIVFSMASVIGSNVVGGTMWIDNVSLKKINPNNAVQSTTANKPILSKTPTTGIYWADSNTATSALNVALSDTVLGRRNLLTYTEDFSNAAWSRTGFLSFGSGSIADALPSTVGPAALDLIIEDTNNVPHRAGQFPAVSTIIGTPINITVYVKQGPGSRYFGCQSLTAAGTYAHCVFDLSTKTYNANALIDSASITELPGGIFRLSIKCTPSAILPNSYAYFYLTTSATAVATTGTSPSYVGDGTSGFYIGGAQLEFGSVATDYQKITNVPAYCTLVRATAEGVTFTDNAEIAAPYNIAPAFSFNADVAIFNRALTATEKALITRYMARAVPMLGSNLVTNGTFDTDTVWTKGTGWSIGSGVASKSAGTASNLTQSVGVSGNTYYAKADAVVTAGTIGAYPGSGTTQFGSTSATGTLAYTMKASGTGIGVRGDASFAGNVDNATIKEIL